jgi:hypothetical protein
LNTPFLFGSRKIDSYVHPIIIKNSMQIILTPQESEEFFYNALCNGLSEMGSYGLEFNYNKDHYAQAKSKLTSPCFEDVLMQILRDGNTIGFEDVECDGEYSKQITLEDVHTKMSSVDPERLLEMKNETDDAGTADVILQTIMYGEVIFG